MKTLYLDCGMGAAGDMLAGALLELMPDKNAALAALNAMGVPHCVFETETLLKCGLAATHLRVRVHGHEEHDHAHHDHGHHHHAHRPLADVLAIVESLALPPRAKANAVKAYESLAAAESRAHAKSVGDVHFHEVGALDAIADIAATCLLMDAIGPGEVVASPVNTGCGTVVCAHGEMPVPAPATAFLLEGLPSYSDGRVDGELCTPTGAALLRLFATRFAPQPLMRVLATGHGAGRKDFPRANVVRAMLGEPFAAEAEEETILELVFNVDDMTGEELAFAARRIFAAGARDVAIAPVTMKKGRPGSMVTVVCARAERDAVLRAIFADTTTIGVRERLCRRHVMRRDLESVALPDGTTVRRKVAEGFGVRRTKWEADDLAAFAEKKGLSLSEARALAEKAPIRRK